MSISAMSARLEARDTGWLTTTLTPITIRFVTAILWTGSPIQTVREKYRRRVYGLTGHS